MKNVIRVVMLAGMLVSFAGIAAARPSDDRSTGVDTRREWRGQQGFHKRGVVDRRQKMQRNRIREGVHCGELTRGETRRLVRGQGRVHRAERRFERDGRLSGRERVRLDRLQDRESGRIYRLKHNRNQRWS